MSSVLHPEDSADFAGMKQYYETHKVPYTLYDGNDRFKGTPVPDGYKAVYIPKDD